MTQDTMNSSSTFFSKVLTNDAFKKGVAGAIAGVLVATVSTLLWDDN